MASCVTSSFLILLSKVICFGEIGRLLFAHPDTVVLDTLSFLQKEDRLNPNFVLISNLILLSMVVFPFYSRSLNRNGSGRFFIKLIQFSVDLVRPSNGFRQDYNA